MLWIFLLIPITVLLLFALIYDKRKKKFHNELKKSEGSNFVENNTSEREYLTTSIDSGQSVDEGENL